MIQNGSKIAIFFIIFLLIYEHTGCQHLKEIIFKTIKAMQKITFELKFNLKLKELVFSYILKSNSIKTDRWEQTFALQIYL